GACAPVQDTPQRARHGPVPADRARAVPEAPRRRRRGARLRDQPKFPQRGNFNAAQPRIHDDGVVLRVPGLRLHDRAYRGAGAPRRADCTRRYQCSLPGQDARLRQAVRARADPGSDPASRRCGVPQRGPARSRIPHAQARSASRTCARKDEARPPAHRHPALRAILLMIAAVGLFTLMDAIAKYLSHWYPVPGIVWARYALNLIILLAWLAARGELRRIRTA